MFVNGIPSPHEAEALCLLQGIHWLKIEGYSQVFIELYCKIVVNAICNVQIHNNEFGGIISNCIEELSALPNFQIPFICSLANQVAHCLAMASRSYASSNDINYIPHCIMLR